VSFTDSDWTRDPPPRPRMPAAQRRALILTIAISVSCMAVALVVYGVEQWLDASAYREAREALKHSSETPVPLAVSDTVPATVPLPAASAAVVSTPLSVQAAPAAASAAANSAAAVDEQPLVALEAEMRQRARESAQQTATDTARRKERAWQRFYQRPDFCADNPTAAQMVQCANHHIRARKEFEERYAAGKL
jgi:hypothetical protein